jgi:alpha 1,3-glucosidase
VWGHNPEYDFTPALFWMNPSDMFYRLQTGAATRNLSIVSEGGFIDFVVFLAPIDQVLPQYFQLTGLPYFPPAFALGYQQCRWGYESQAVVEGVMSNLSAVNFPQDVQWLDIDHLDGQKPFITSPTWFTNSTKFFEDAASAGRTVIRITDPHMFESPDYRPFAEADARNYLVQKDGDTFIADCWPGSVGWVDFLITDARTWWGGLFSEYEYPENVHVWNDMNEAAAWESLEGTLPKDAVQLNGSVEVREVHSMYGISNAAGTHFGLLKAFPNRRPFVLTRSFFAGSQKFTWHWSGDNSPTYEHLALSLYTLLASNLAGVPFTGSDIGGFQEATTPELLARWHQLGAYVYPLCREHVQVNAPPREPYLYKDSHPELFQAMLTAVVDRYRLLPLLYTALRDASEFGQPFVAPIWYYFPRARFDSLIASRQPIIGGKLMVVPQLEEDQINVSVVKPPGLWYNLRTGKQLDDGEILPTGWSDHVPAFLRGGSVTALFNDHGMTVAKTYENNLTVYIALDEGGTASGSLYFDDLISLDHQNEDFLRTSITFDYSQLSIEATGLYGPVSNVTRIVVYGATQKPDFVIPRAIVTFDNGTVVLFGLDLSLDNDQVFVSTTPTALETPTPGPAPTQAETPGKTGTEGPAPTAAPVEIPTRTLPETPGAMPTPTSAETPVETSASTSTPTPSSGLSRSAVVVTAITCSFAGLAIVLVVILLVRRRRMELRDHAAHKPLLGVEREDAGAD